jgi:hypothetical protein
MFWSKLYPTKYDLVIAICDEDLLDKKIGKKFKIKISKEFYGGKLIDADIALKLMKKATIGNLIGKKIVKLAEENGFIIKENIIVIDGVPHAQFVKI